MPTSGNADLSVTRTSWAKLRRLRAAPIDLSRVRLLREAGLDALRDPRRLEALLAELGLNDEGMEEYPPALHPFCGRGLRIWQYPSQMSRYLADAASLGVRSYLEVGVRHGGSFVATVEYLERFAPLDWAAGVDLLPCPGLDAYGRMNPRARFARLNTQSDAYARFVAGLGEIGLVLVDAFHDEAQCRAEVDAVRPYARAIAVHDVASADFPGVARVWEELKASGGYECREYLEQYPGVGGPYMGIGLAIRKETR
jgi:cephalosporin hydroxylase